MAQIATVNTLVTLELGWVKVATNPVACTIHSNGELNCAVAVTVLDAAPTTAGELHFGRMHRDFGTVAGYIWVRAVGTAVDFAVTVLEA